MDIRVLVGGNLRQMRLSRGLSQEVLADEAGIAPSFLSQIETGKRSPTVTTLHALATVLEMPMSEFFAQGGIVPKGLPRGRRGK